MRDTKYLSTFDLPSRIAKTLAVMKSAREKNELMSIWESDVLAIEEALAALSPAGHCTCKPLTRYAGDEHDDECAQSPADHKSET